MSGNGYFGIERLIPPGRGKIEIRDGVKIDKQALCRKRGSVVQVRNADLICVGAGGKRVAYMLDHGAAVTGRIVYVLLPDNDSDLLLDKIIPLGKRIVNHLEHRVFFVGIAVRQYLGGSGLIYAAGKEGYLCAAVIDTCQAVYKTSARFGGFVPAVIGIAGGKSAHKQNDRKY